MLRVVFFGTPEFAVPSLDVLIRGPHPVVGAVTQPDRPSGRGRKVVAPPVKQLAAAHGVPVWQPDRLKDPSFLDVLRGLAPDVGVVAAYGRILPDALLAIPRFGLLNVHASLLPAWRGASPVHHAVMAGDAETGVTIMRVVRELDAGPMLARGVRAIGPEETSAEIERDLAVLGASLLPDVLESLEAGTLAEEPQDHARATYAPRLTRADGAIDWTLDAAALARRVRGLQPWPLATTVLGHATIAVLRARAVPASELSRTDADAGRTGEPLPGTIVAARGRLFVACGAGTVLEILDLQPSDRRVMSAREFLAGHRVESGTRSGTDAT